LAKYLCDPLGPNYRWTTLLSKEWAGAGGRKLGLMRITPNCNVEAGEIADAATTTS